MKRIFVSDCEGPISKNDNAFELAANFIPNGDRLFANISKYDDVLADVLQKPGYSAGSTLKLILPFLKAYDVTDQHMEEFSIQNIILIANSKSTLHHVQGVASAFIVSTSYEHYIKALCKALDFPYKNTYCTKLALDKYQIIENEKSFLRKVAEEIAQLHIINITPETKTVESFSNKDQATIQQLDEIFWGKIPKLSLGRILSDVTTVGGAQKAEAIKDAAKRSGVRLEDVMYVGDSITDVEAFKLVRANGGLTVSFNGNSYAVRNAEVAVMSENSEPTSRIADLFFQHGKDRTIQALSGTSVPKAQIVTAENMEAIVKESSGFRKKVRGVAIGRLG